MHPQGAGFLNLLQHEAGHLAVVLEDSIGKAELGRDETGDPPEAQRRLTETTYCLLAPGATDGHDLLAVESELLLEALWTDRVAGAQGGFVETQPCCHHQPLLTQENEAHQKQKQTNPKLQV